MWDYILSIEIFGNRIGSSCYLSEYEDDEEWKNAFEQREDEITKKQHPYSNSLDTLIQNTKNKNSYGIGKEYLALKNWCISRYKDTFLLFFKNLKFKS